MRSLDAFPLPRSAPKTSPYGPRGGRLHAGVDYGVPVGTPVVAPWAGRVSQGFEAAGAGNWIWVVADSGDVFKCFHLSGYTVANGAQVAAGQSIARTGNTGASTGPHAHMELHSGGPAHPIDPTPYFDAAQYGAQPTAVPPVADPQPAPTGDIMVPHVLDGRFFLLVPHASPHGFAWQALDNPTTVADLYAAGVADPSKTVQLGKGDTEADARFERYAVLSPDGTVERGPVR